MDSPNYKDYLRGLIQNLPESPGIYQYLDDTGRIIYVGKAKNLKRRVSSYFQKEHDSAKTRLLVTKIRDLKYIVVNSEQDALLLENNLIKQHQPRYNVLLKDDKTYPYIAVTKEEFPRIFKTRNIDKKGAFYYGPYTHLPSMYALLELIHHLLKIRSCSMSMSSKGISERKYKICLKYHLKLCDGVCIGSISSEEYQKRIEQAKSILRGETSEISRQYLQEMNFLASNLQFEEAQLLKEKYELIENYKAKSEIVSQEVNNVDDFSIVDDETSAYINYLHIVSGCITQAFTFEYKKKLIETQTELLELGITEMRARYKSSSREIIVPFEPDFTLENVTFTIPQRGEKRKLLDLSRLNVKQYKADRLKQADKLNPEQRGMRLMKELQELLNLKNLPFQLECFDNSNLQGSNPVAACVVFKNANPSKKDYKKYHIKTVIGADDYASMKEVARRRYSRIIEEKGTLPDLILTDGGKGQMESMREVIEVELHLHIPILGLVKGQKHRTSEILFGFPQINIGLKAGTPLFHLFERIQDEVHRFAIQFHKEQRSKQQTSSKLDSIKGIGEKTKQILLKTFKSVKRIADATETELIECVGSAKAKILLKALKEEPKDPA